MGLLPPKAGIGRNTAERKKRRTMTPHAPKTRQGGGRSQCSALLALEGVVASRSDASRSSPPTRRYRPPGRRVHRKSRRRCPLVHGSVLQHTLGHQAREIGPCPAGNDGPSSRRTAAEWQEMSRKMERSGATYTACYLLAFFSSFFHSHLL